MPKPRKTSAFPEPKANYTKLPNVLFDSHLNALSPAAVKLILLIFRKTWGWQKIFAHIALSVFIKHTGIKSKNTVRKAIEELLEKELILRYEDGRGSNTKSYFWINTEKGLHIFQAVASGRLSIEEAQNLSSGNVDNSEVIHNHTEADVSNADTRNGSNIEPRNERYHGSLSDPTKRTRTRKQTDRKKGFPRYPELSISESDSVEHIREQRLTRKRLLEEPSSQPTLSSENSSKINSQSET